MRNRKKQRANRKKYKALNNNGGVSVRNAEGYVDRTATAAINNVLRKK